MHEEQRQRAHDALKVRDIHRALFANPATVTWLTGFVEPIQPSVSPFTASTPLVYYEDGVFTLIVRDAFAADAQATGCPVHTYASYTIDTPIRSGENLTSLLHQIAGKTSDDMLVGVEDSFAIRPALMSVAPKGRVTGLDGIFDSLRMVKTAEEIEKLRYNFSLGDIGHAAARRGVVAGRREIDVWTDFQTAIEQAAGVRVPLGNDCVVGYRENNIGGLPGDLALRPGDSIIVDISAVHRGYRSDSCGTYYAGEPSEKQKAMHKTAADALDFAISLVRPGVAANEIDRRVRQFIADAGYPVYPHHTGHGVGVYGHEAPRIVPYDTTPLEAGMVIMLEPGIYFPGEAGVRLEDALLVTSDGAEVLTRHDKSLP